MLTVSVKGTASPSGTVQSIALVSPQCATMRWRFSDAKKGARGSSSECSNATVAVEPALRDQHSEGKGQIQCQCMLDER